MVLVLVSIGTQAYGGGKLIIVGVHISIFVLKTIDFKRN
jgi:hypothetical protein